MEWTKYKGRNKKIKSLRRKGKSMKDIAKMLNCGKSMVSYHCQGIRISNSQRRKLIERVSLNALNGSRHAKLDWDDKKAKVISAAKDEWPSVKNNPEMMGFLGLYWGEGTKRSGNISIVNNDEGIILASLKVFKKLDPEANITCVVKCYPDHDKEKCREFWYDLLKLDIKVRDKKLVGKTRRHYSKNGLCVLQFSNWQVYHKILTWINCWREELKSIS